MLTYEYKVCFIILISFFCIAAFSNIRADENNTAENFDTQAKKASKNIIEENALVAMSISLENENNHVPLEKTIDKVTFKFLRGATNVVTACGEIPRQLILSAMNDDVLLVVPLGLSRGIALTVVRTVTGLVDTLFFYCSPDGSYGSYLNPDFVWQPAQHNPRKQYPPLN